MKTFWVSGEKHVAGDLSVSKSSGTWHQWFPNIKTQRKTQSAKNTLRLSALPWPEKNSLYGLLCVGSVPTLPAKQLPSNPAFPTTFPRTRSVPRKKVQHLIFSLDNPLI